MSGTDGAKSRQLFEHAVALQSAERSAFLDSACGEDAELRAEVEELLKLSDQPDGPLDRPAVELLRAPPENLRPGERLGRYTINSLLGEGGMGVVYKARQEAPERDVAVKVIHEGLVGRNAVRRFAQEAAVLGRLKHPGIAAVIEASLLDGRPFIAMELVEGESITHYASEKKLTLERKLELIASICDALHHAHVKGVVHRDIKPGNILVDGAGQPRLLDFGIARLTEEGGAKMTAAGQLVGTLAYMSPEQTGWDPSKVDARSDIYSVGVVLYELVCGVLPIAVNDGAVVDAVMRIQSEEPRRPGALKRGTPSDVESIVMRALEKDPATRYQHASDLAADIRRYLAHEPVLARPQTAIYQLGKFARRNRALVGAFALVMLAILGGLAGVSVAMVRAWRAEGRAAEQARIARDEAGRATRFGDFLRGMLSLDPSTLQGKDSTVLRQMLQLAEKRLPSLEQDQETRTAILAVIGNSYRDFGYPADALRVLEEAAKTSAVLKGDEAIDTLFARDALAAAKLTVSDFVSAEKDLREIAAARDRSDPDAGRRAITWSNLGVALEAQAHYDEAMEACRRAAELYQSADDQEAVASVRVRESWLLARLGRTEQAEKVLRETLDRRVAQFGWEDSRTVKDYIDWCRLLALMGRNEEARADLIRCLGLSEKVNGRDTSITLTVLELLVGVCIDLSRWDEAEAHALRLLDGLGTTMGTDVLAYWGHHMNVAAIYRLRGMPEKAERYSKAAVDGVLRLAPEGCYFTGPVLAGHAETLRMLERREEEVAVLEKAWTHYAEGRFADPDRAAVMAGHLADAYAFLGDPDRAHMWSDRAAVVSDDPTEQQE